MEQARILLLAITEFQTMFAIGAFLTFICVLILMFLADSISKITHNK